MQVLFQCEPPTLKEKNKGLDSGLINIYDDKIDYFNDKLNNEQKEAVKLSLKANELFILHGPPGTGKTETITEIILQNIQLKNKILISSSSNIAVDTIAERLLRFNYKDYFKVCRIGHPVRILEEVYEISVDNIIEECYGLGVEIEKLLFNEELSPSEKDEKRRELENIRKTKTMELFDECQIIFCTNTSSATNDLLEYLESYQKYFDLLIIDEASQSKESESFIPISISKKYFCLI